MMALFSPPYSISFHPPFSSKTSHAVKLASDSVFFILGYLLRGLVAIVIKKSMLKFAALAVCNAGSIYYYLSPTLESMNRFLGPTRMWRAIHLDVVISIATRIGSTIQTGVLSIFLSAAVTGIDAVVRLRGLKRTAANSVTTFLKRPIPFVFRKKKLEYERESFEDVIHHTRSAPHGIPTKVPPKSKQGQRDNNLVPKHRKRIDVTEIIGEEAMAEDELVQT
jgi:hypothetical protein